MTGMQDFYYASSFTNPTNPQTLQTHKLYKQPLEMFCCKKVVLENLRNFTGKLCVGVSFK